MQRLYDIGGGKILIDGQDVSKATQASLAARRSRSCSRSRSCFTVRSPKTSPTAGRARASTRSIEAAQARQRARVHRAAAERLRHAGRRARREAVGRRAAARGAGARVPGGRADPDPGRGDLEPRFGIGGADPGGDAAADARPHVDRDRAPSVDGARAGPHPRVRPRRDRRRKARIDAGAPRAASTARCSSGRCWSSAARSWTAHRRRSDAKERPYNLGVMPGHSRSKNGVDALANVPGIHDLTV